MKIIESFVLALLLAASASAQEGTPSPTGEYRLSVERLAGDGREALVVYRGEERAAVLRSADYDAAALAPLRWLDADSFLFVVGENDERTLHYRDLGTGSEFPVDPAAWNLVEGAVVEEGETFIPTTREGAIVDYRVAERKTDPVFERIEGEWTRLFHDGARFYHLKPDDPDAGTMTVRRVEGDPIIVVEGSERGEKFRFEIEKARLEKGAVALEFVDEFGNERSARVVIDDEEPPKLYWYFVDEHGVEYNGRVYVRSKHADRFPDVDK
ncbi:MAG: hypothetical protein GF419_12885 [Ignavibacteriales bacterium]|nr:hypothetical protein [Ignavibacteriales bacterium]